jgi:Tfp pilus assembly protein PilO
MVIGALVVFVSFIRPAYSDSQTLKAQIYSKRISLENEREAAAQVQNLLDQYRGEQSPQSVVSMALPPEDDQAEAIHQIQVLAAANQLGLQSVSVNRPGAKPLNQRSLVKPVGVIGLQIRVAGSYANLKSFLQGLETNIRITDIQALVISPVGNADQDFYTFDLALAVYYQSF